MVIYNCSSIGSDIKGYDLFNGEAAAASSPVGSFAVSVLAAGILTGGWHTPAGTPSSDAWESGGTISFKLEVLATNGGDATWRGRCRIQRRSADGTILQTGTFSTFIALNTVGVKTFSIPVPTWTAAEEACSNRISIQCQFNNGTGATRTCTIGADTSNNEIDSPITENSATCRRVFSL